MDKKDIQRGKDLATQALLFAVLARDISKLERGELRKGVRLLFGPEVDDALESNFDRDDG